MDLSEIRRVGRTYTVLHETQALHSDLVLESSQRQVSNFENIPIRVEYIPVRRTGTLSIPRNFGEQFAACLKGCNGFEDCSESGGSCDFLFDRLTVNES